jgi:uncharacterized protein YqeY
MVLDKLKIDMLKSRKEANELKMAVLSFLISAINNKEIELRPMHEELTDEHVQKVILKQIKNRTQAIEAYEKAGRQELVDKESAEKKVLEEILNAYFPQTQSTQA